MSEYSLLTPFIAKAMKNTAKTTVFCIPLVLLGTLVSILETGAHQQGSKSGDKLDLSNEQILAKVYDKSYKTPKDFYQDPALKDANFSLYFHQPGWLATEKEKARKIVEDFLAKPSGIKDKKIEQTNVTPKFFDFQAGKIWFRVHNSNYFNPKGPRIDSGLPFAGAVGKPTVLGTLKVKPVTKSSVQGLAEYLWLIRFYNLGGAKVLKSEASEQNGKLVATLFTTQVVYGDFGLSDEISVYREVFSADPKTGLISYNQQKVRNLTGKKN